MSSEINIGYFFPEMGEFIHKTYGSVDPAQIEQLISRRKQECDEENKSRAQKNVIELWGERDPLTSLKNNAYDFAESYGISDDLLVTLGAIQKMESELPIEDRALTPKRYLQLLVLGELSRARNLGRAQVETNFETSDVEVHTQRASKLLDFLKDFE